MASDPYRPVSCALHSELELAILHKHWLDLRWTDRNQTRTARVKPRDLETREGNEYLIVEDGTENTWSIRLDHIESFAICRETGR